MPPQIERKLQPISQEPEQQDIHDFEDDNAVKGKGKGTEKDVKDAAYALDPRRNELMRQNLQKVQKKICETIASGKNITPEVTAPLETLGISSDLPLNEIMAEIDSKTSELTPEGEKKKQFAEFGFFLHRKDRIGKESNVNEDALRMKALENGDQVIVNADGVTTAVKSEYASLAAANSVLETLGTMKQKTAKAFRTAHEMLKNLHGKIFTGPEAKKNVLDTTITSAQIYMQNGKAMIRVGNVGDSRCVIWRLGENGAVQKERLSSDSSLLQQFVDEGILSKEQLDLMDQASTPEEFATLKKQTCMLPNNLYDELVQQNLIAPIPPSEGDQKKSKMVTLDTVYRFRNIINDAITNEHAPIRPFEKELELKKGDIFAVYSDGVADPLSEKEIYAIFSSEMKKNPMTPLGDIAGVIGYAAYERNSELDPDKQNPRAKKDGDDISIALGRVKDIEQVIAHRAISETKAFEKLHASNPETYQKITSDLAKELKAYGIDVGKDPRYQKHNVTELAQLLRARASIEDQPTVQKIHATHFASEQEKIIASMQFADKNKWKENWKVLKEHGFDIEKQTIKNPEKFQAFVRDQLTRFGTKRTLVELSGKKVIPTQTILSVVERMMPDKDRAQISYQTKELQKMLSGCNLNQPEAKYGEKEKAAVQYIEKWLNKTEEGKKSFWQKLRKK